MNQTIRNSGGKSAAPSRSDRVFRRSLTPTLALLAAMSLGLVAPSAADAQTRDLTLSGGGGGGGGGESGFTSGGAGGNGGAGGSGAGGAGGAAGGVSGVTPISPSNGGAGGTGGDNSMFAGANGQGGGGAATKGSALGGYVSTISGGSASPSAGGTGGNASYSVSTNEAYSNISMIASDGGSGGFTGVGTQNAPAGGGGRGGNVSFFAWSGVASTLSGDLTIMSGSDGAVNNGGGGIGGSAAFNHQGTLNVVTGTHAFDIGNNAPAALDRSAVNVYINNLQLNNAAAVNIDLSTLRSVPLSARAANSVLFDTLTFNRGGTINATFNGTAGWGTSNGFSFSNLYVTGYNGADPSTRAVVNLNNATRGYTPGANGKIYFALNNDVVATSIPIVRFGTISGGAQGVDLTGFNPANMHIISEQNYYYKNLHDGQVITLISGVQNAGAYANPYRTTIYKGGLRFEDFIYQVQGNNLNVTYGKAQSVRTGEAFSPYFQGQMAALYAVSGASRPVLEGATKALVDTPTSVGEPLVSLYLTGSSTTLNTGSSVDVDSFGGVLAVGTKLNNDAGLTTVAAFAEMGTGSYDTYKNIPDLYVYNNGKFIGSGDTDYAGGGVFLHHLFDANHFAGGFSVEGSFRVGSVKNDYNLDMLDRSGYDISRTYWAGHVGLGYNYLLTNMDSVDMFGQLHMAYVENGTLNTTAGERLHFLAAKSTVSRLGGRYNHNFNELLKGYATAAWEYEFEGDVGGSVDRTRIQKAPNIEGSSGFGQLGLNVKSATTPVSLDLSVFGVTGQQEGYGGTLGLKLDF